MLGRFNVSVRGMEQFGARKETPLETCIVEVEQSDIYVGIVAFRLGSLEPNSSKSYTQLEYERALALSKEVLIYLIDEENSRVAVKFIDKGESGERLEAFKRILRERHTVDTFVDETDLTSKLERDLKRHLSLRSQASQSPDEIEDSRAKLAQFYLLPKSVAGAEVRVCLRVSGDPFPASFAICKAFNFEFGATIGVPIKLVQPVEINRCGFTEVFINSRFTDKILPLEKGDQITSYVRLHFSDSEIVQISARYVSHTDYPYSPLGRSAVQNVLGEAVHYPADSRLAVELSKIIEVERNVKSAI